MTASATLHVPSEALIGVALFAAGTFAALFGWSLREVFRIAIAVSRLTVQVQALHDANEDTNGDLDRVRDELRRIAVPPRPPGGPPP